MDELKLSAPWIMYCKQAKALFQKDPTGDVVFDEDNMELKFLVKGEAKANALTKYLPSEKTYGNVTMAINVYPANEEPSIADLLHDIFDRNDALKFIHTNEGPILTGLNYVVFKPAVVQFFADNLRDINGNCSTLYEDLARAVFRQDIPDVAFCTDSATYELSKPIGDWPSGKEG